jgi:predicted nucleic acid-binding protein
MESFVSDATQHFYWDTCVFVAYLNDERQAYGNAIDDIEQFLEESKRGDWKIYTSTITIAEIPRSRLKNRVTFPSFVEFLYDYQSAIVQIAPDPNIMEAAGQLHGMLYTKGHGIRRLDTPDAIHLARSCGRIEPSIA